MKRKDMAFFNEFINKFFASNNPDRNQPVKEVLKRSEKYQAAYLNWRQEKKHIPLVQSIAQSYHYRRTNIFTSIQIHLFRSQGAQGFAISYKPSFGAENFRHLLDHFKDRVLELNYRVNLAESAMAEKPSYVEHKEKYYLKPDISWEEIRDARINQRYGNILLEWVEIDNRPSYLKVLVTFYQDHQFSLVWDYDEFVDKLFIV
ncbi:MAG: hypothetical protein HC880_13075 [Bacteroidia bacterium]|nr:hypothetical protein [Bacteroidia bacterium]